MASPLDALPPVIRDALRSDLTVDITTTGRRSGEQRRIEIWFLNIDDTIYITGTPGARDWMANLSANPAFVFHLKESTVADLSASAEVVTDRAERSRVFAHASASWYSNQGDSMSSLVDEAPMVRVVLKA